MRDRGKTAVAVLGSVLLSLVLVACSNSGMGTSDPNDESSPIYLKIGGEAANVSAASGGKARLEMDFTVENTSKARSAEMPDLPQLTLNGEPVEVTYTHQDSTKSTLGPGEDAYGSVDVEYDEASEHEWRFEEQPGTVVSGLDRYVAIIEAERNYEGKPPVTTEEIEQMEAEHERAYEEFLENEGLMEEDAVSQVE